MAKVFVVGVGLDGRDSLLPHTLQILKDADIVVASQRLLDSTQQEGAEHWVFGDIAVTLQRVSSYIDRHDDCVVVILATGDPLFYGIGRLILNYIAKENVTFIPHFSSIQLAFTRLKMPWQDASVLSVHGRSFDELLLAVRKGHSKIAVLTDPCHSPAAIANSILALDIPIHYKAWVCENLGANDERVRCFTLAGLLGQEFSALSVLVLVRQTSALALKSVDNLPLFGIPDHLFETFDDRPGLMTKREIRVLALGELALQPHHICWDIGAGTGSMSVEMSRLVPEGQVYALEKTSAGTLLIQKNSRQFKVNNLQSSQGKAPVDLENFPTPDRIFIGGSSSQLISILTFCEKALAKQGRIVLAIATLENLNLALMWFKQRQWDSKTLQVQLAKSLPIADLTRFQPLNPVFLITAEP